MSTMTPDMLEGVINLLEKNTGIGDPVPQVITSDVMVSLSVILILWSAFNV